MGEDGRVQRAGFLGPLRQAAHRYRDRANKRSVSWPQRHGLWLVSGSLYERSATRLQHGPGHRSRGRGGRPLQEDVPVRALRAGIAAGHEFLAFDVPELGRFGLSICYDMWIPETSRTLAAMGAEVILRPTLTGTIDRDVELSIVRATAAMNQCFVFDINGVGDGGYGRSIVCGP